MEGIVPIQEGQQTMANSSPVVIASDQSAIPVSGTVSVGSLPAGNNVIGQVKITDGTDIADVLDLTNSNPLTVAIVDGNGDQIASFGGGTQYTEDAAAAANPIGTAVNLIRQDTPAELVTTDGDNVAQRGTNYGAAYTQVVTSAGAFVDTFGGGTQYADGAADATPTGTLAMGTDGANVFAVHTDTAGDLQVDILTSALPTGASTSALQTTGNTSLATIAGAVSGTEMQVDVLTMPTVTVEATNLDVRDLVFATDKVDASGTVLGAGTNNIGDVDVLTLPAITIAAAQTLATVTTVGTVTTITNTVPTKEVRSATPAQTSPSVTNASTSILASNANRLGATIYNEGAAICYMKLGATASTTSYTLQISVGGYYELPFGYTGAIDGITSAGTAQLRVTELT